MLRAASGPLPVRPTVVNEIDSMSYVPAQTWKVHEILMRKVPREGSNTKKKTV